MDSCSLAAISIFSGICCLYMSASCCFYCDRYYTIQQENNRIYNNVNNLRVITPTRILEIAPIIHRIFNNDTENNHNEKNNIIIKTVIIENPSINENDDNEKYYIGFAINNLSIPKVVVK